MKFLSKIKSWIWIDKKDPVVLKKAKIRIRNGIVLYAFVPHGLNFHVNEFILANEDGRVGGASLNDLRNRALNDQQMNSYQGLRQTTRDNFLDLN